MEPQKFCAVLIDTVSIQHYIFSSNRLKENIGASYIIEHLIYNNLMIKILEAQFHSDGSFVKTWATDDVVKIIDNSSVQCEVGYIGGGNALVLFRKKEDVNKFIQEYTRSLLEQFPGLRTAFGIIYDFDPTSSNNGFQKSRERLNKKLIYNKSLQSVNVIPFKHGILSDCPLSNEAQETGFRAQNNISVMTAVKLMAAVDSQEGLMEIYKDEVGRDYVFTDKLEDLGQEEDKGYIAVVHADGNGMGEKFIQCKDLVEMRKLSTHVSGLAITAMRKLVRYTVNLFTEKKLNKDIGFELKFYKADKHAEKNNVEKQWEGKRKILPIRPIIVGGDDITFVCEGRLGVHLAEKLIKFMTAKENGTDPISACTGVAIVHTKYPFYRAYRLANDLTDEAKKASRPIKNSSWISFLISSGGFSGSLDQVKEKMFSTPNGSLYGGPYRLDNPVDSFAALKKGIRELAINNKTKWPRSKLMALRDVLRKDKPGIQYFMADCKARGRKLPVYPGQNYHEELWIDEKTPYYDLIELMDFYPIELNHE